MLEVPMCTQASNVQDWGNLGKVRTWRTLIVFKRTNRQDDSTSTFDSQGKNGRRFRAGHIPFSSLQTKPEPSLPYYRVRREHSADRLLESWGCVPTPHHDRNPLARHIVDCQEDSGRPGRVHPPARRRDECQRLLVLRDSRVHEHKPRADMEPMCGEPEVHERHFLSTMPIPSRISNLSHIRRVPGWTYLGSWRCHG